MPRGVSLTDSAFIENRIDNNFPNAIADFGNAPFFDADALSYIRRVEQADGLPLEAGVKVAYNEFITCCKTLGIWNAIKASCILAGARTLAGALVPLVGTAPTNNNFVTADYNRKTGLVGDGSTKYLAANYTYPSGLQNNCHASVWESGSTTSGVYFGAADDTASGTFISAVNKSSRHYNSSISAFIPTTFGTTGIQGVSRSSESSYSYRSAVGGTQTASIASAVLTLPSFSIFRRNRPTTADNYSNARLAFYSIGESINLQILETEVTQLINNISNAII
jgi:hypothetical protein